MTAWTTPQLRRAHRLNDAGCSLDDIGRRLHRSRRSVACKLSKYGPDGARIDHRPRMTTATLVAELERRGYTCTPPEQLPARIDL